MICPKCEYEYIDDVKLCPDCNAELISVEDFQGNLLNPSDWVILCNCKDKYQAMMLKSNLKGADIESLILDQEDRSFPMQGDLEVVKLFVKKTEANVALQIVNKILNEE